LHLFLSLKLADIHGLQLLVLSRVPASFLTHDDIVNAIFLATFCAFGPLLGTFSVPRLTIVVIGAPQVFQLLLGLLLLLVYADGCARLRHANLFPIIVVKVHLCALLLRGGLGSGATSDLLSFLFLVNQAFIFHTSLVVAAITLLFTFFFIELIALVISNLLQLLPRLEVVQRGALLEGFAAVIYHYDFLLRALHHVHMVQGSVRVDNVRLNFVLLSVEPFLLHIESASTVYED